MSCISSQHHAIPAPAGENTFLQVDHAGLSTICIRLLDSHAALDDGEVSPTLDERELVSFAIAGTLTGGLLHALVAMDMPGPGTVFLSQNWKFTVPVCIDDTITAEAEIISVHPSKPVTELRVQIRRSDDTIVLEGEAWCYTFSDSRA